MITSQTSINYHPFSTFIFRTPYLSFQTFEENIKRLENNESYWKEFLQYSYLQEAIFLASPVLFEEIQKFLSDELTIPKEVGKLKMAVMRYYTRMATRCTPFGLFAGFSLGKLGDKTDIKLVSPKDYGRYTRLDMNYLCNLVQDIEKIDTVRNALRYYPNTSIYPLGNQLRYVEYYYQNARRVHHITAVDRSEYLENVLQKAEFGATLQELTTLLVNDEINMEEATGFIAELIDNQIIVSELEPSVTEKDFLKQLSISLKDITKIDETKEKLQQLDGLLSEIDQNTIGETLTLYAQIEKTVKEIKTAYEAKFLFQTDMYKPTQKSFLDQQITQDILGALDLMNKLSPPQSETLLSKFTENYYERYEGKEMPLLQVLDTETGIGYQQSSGDINPLLKGFILPAKQTETVDVKWNRIQSVLHKKFLDAYRNKDFLIEISDKDFDFLTSNWTDIPPTISCMCKIFSVQNELPLIYVHSAGGSSAANLLGRFCHVTKELEDYVIEITNFEQSQNQDIIYAEIVHLPESRIGNILLRPILRPYEIPYLGKSAVDKEHQIPLSDLYVSVKDEKVRLRSKRLNKEIVLRLSTAHNYSFNSMPVYHFLCDMQTQGLRGGIGFSWGSLANEYEFLPRVQYKNVILSLAKWTIKTEDFKKLILNKTSDKISKDEMLEKIFEWRKEKQIPRFVVLPDGDNDLFVDLENTLSIQTLFATIKQRPSFALEEFPFDPDHAIVKDEMGQSFTNEFVFGFYKNQDQQT